LTDDERLTRLLELRKYKELTTLIEDILENEGWSEFISQVRRISIKSEAVPGWEIPLRTGIIRDAFTSILDLQLVKGLDGDFLRIFEGLNAGTLQELRAQAMDCSITVLREQVRKGNTFFLVTEPLADTPYSVLIPDVLQIRSRQINTLEEKPAFSELYSTYYGFTILTSGGVSRDQSGATSESIREIEILARQLGSDKKVTRRQIKHSPSVFGRVSEHTRNLLWNLLSLCIGGIHNQKSAAKTLGQLGDSRATEIMHLKLDRTEDDGIAAEVIRGLGNIGDPNSFSCIRDLYGSRSYGYNRRMKAARSAIGGIRHPAVLELLAEGSPGYWGFDLEKIEALGYTRNPEFIPALVQQLTSGRKGDNREKKLRSFRSLKQIGSEGLEKLREHYEDILKVDGYLEEAVSLLGSIPDFKWTSSMIDVVTEGLSMDNHEKLISAVQLDSQLMGNPRIQTAMKRKVIA